MDKILDREGMEYLVNLGRKTMEVKTIDIDGHTYVSEKMTRIDPVDDPAPAKLAVYSLSGLVDYLKTDIDKMFKDGKRYIAVVESPVSVKVYSQLSGYANVRNCLVSCDVNIPQIRFDTYMDSEDFMIMLMTRFEDSENRELVLKIVGNMREEQSNQVADDGFTQKVTIKNGIAKVDDVAVKNPVYLSPRRTFHEVMQSISPFVLRFKEGPQAALFEADGGAWKNDAVAYVGRWLVEQLEGLAVEVIA